MNGQRSPKLAEALRLLREGKAPRKPQAKPVEAAKPVEVVAPLKIVESEESSIPGPRRRIIKRGWGANPTTQTSYQVYQPSKSDEIKELQLQNAAAARRERLLRDEYGFWGGDETIEDVTRRQDARWRR
jgi:hypothetical protein